MNTHPAIDPDYPAGIAAMRQLCCGARPSFRANYFDLYKREGYDHLYFRGLALRHSNGESGKYETFTYEATPELLLWARTNVLKTFDEVLAGRDVAKEIRNLKRRARYDQNTVCARSVPSSSDVNHRVLVELQSPLGTCNEDGEFSSRGLTD